jgi:uroporphyrinogen decarboxylase
VPVFNSFTPELAERLRKEMDVPQEKDLGLHLGNDMVVGGAGMEKSFYRSDEPEYVCPWGITWRNVRNATGRYTEIARFPLAGDEDKLARWETPDPLDKGNFTDVRNKLETYGDSVWVTGSCRCTLFESAWYLRGMDQLFMDMMLNPEYAHALFEKIMAYPRALLSEFIRMGVDMVWVGDDVATQRGMLMSPEMWRTYIKPQYASLISELKTLRPEIKIAYHSCGNCRDVIPELIEIGIDVLHPIQPKAMDPVLVKRDFGNRIVLFGGMDIQEIMPFGDTETVEREVDRLIEGCSPGGGFILAGAHHLQADTPTENILAFYRRVVRSR